MSGPAEDQQDGDLDPSLSIAPDRHTRLAITTHPAIKKIARASACYLAGSAVRQSVQEPDWPHVARELKRKSVMLAFCGKDTG